MIDDDVDEKTPLNTEEKVTFKYILFLTDSSLF